MEKNIVYGDVAERLFDEALFYMQLRMGWQFEDEIGDALILFFRECGLPLDNGLAYITDNIYCGGSYGFIEELSKEDRERVEKAAEDDDLIYWNPESGAFIETLGNI